MGSGVLRFDDDRMERWTPDGDVYAVEHWHPGSAYPKGEAVHGTALGSES